MVWSCHKRGLSCRKEGNGNRRAREEKERMSQRRWLDSASRSRGAVIVTGGSIAEK